MRKGLFRQHGSELEIFHRVLDGLVIVGALWLCGQGYGVSIEVHYALAGLLAVVGFLFFAELNGLYGSWRAGSIRSEAWSIVTVWFFTLCVLLAIGFLGKSSIQFSRFTLGAWALATPALLIGQRIVLRYLLRQV